MVELVQPELSEPPMPGAASTRIAGKAGALYFWSVVRFGSAWVRVLDLYDWKVEVSAEIFPCPIKGNTWRRKTVGQGDGVLTAERYVTAGSVLAFGVPYSVTIADRVDFIVFAVDNDNNPSTNNFSYVQGTGYVQSGSLSCPRGAYRDNFSLALDTIPVIK